jgi:hypothetical protein
MHRIYKLLNETNRYNLSFQSMTPDNRKYYLVLFMHDWIRFLHIKIQDAFYTLLCLKNTISSNKVHVMVNSGINSWILSASDAPRDDSNLFPNPTVVTHKGTSRVALCPKVKGNQLFSYNWNGLIKYSLLMTFTYPASIFRL